MCIGEYDISPSDYWKLTRAETIGIITGRRLQRDLRSADFRNLYGLLLKINTKERRPIERLWPLLIDEMKKPELTADEMYERNRKILKNGSVS